MLQTQLDTFQKVCLLFLVDLCGKLRRLWLIGCVLAGEYLIGDSAYNCSSTVVASYKGDAADVDRNEDFNWCVAKARVRNEHCIGVMKRRWASLNEIRIELNGENDIGYVLDWIVVCAILHNMLASLGDQWDKLGCKGEEPARRSGPAFEALPGESPYELGLRHREAVRDHTVVHCLHSGILPIKK